MTDTNRAPPKPTDTSPEVAYKPSADLAALVAMPKRYLIVVDEALANESCPVPPEYGDGHKLGKIKLHPYKFPEERPPLGFIIMPSAKVIEVIQDKFPEVYELLKEQKINLFPYNGP